MMILRKDSRMTTVMVFAEKENDDKEVQIGTM